MKIRSDIKGLYNTRIKKADNVNKQSSDHLIRSQSRDVIEIHGDNSMREFKDTLVQEIRSEIMAPASKEKLQNLSEQIDNGTYHVDSDYIADTILMRQRVMLHDK